MTKAQPPVRAVTYCRISHDMIGQGAGVDRQRIDTERICADRKWTVIDRLVDNDRSASRYAKKPREGWNRLLELLEAKAVDALVAYDLDRLTRRPDELAPLIRAAEAGIKIVTATGSLLDLSTGDGIFAARILLAVAEKEAANTSRRAKAKLRHDADAGRPHWVRRPFGFALGGGVVETEAAWVRKMVGWIADEGLSANATAVRLNDAGVKQDTGKPWQGAGVKMLVTSPRNIGLRTYHGKIVGPATWPAIVDEDHWRRACASLSLRALGTRQGRRSMLTGLVRCGKCGNVMTRTTNGSRSPILMCSKRVDIGLGCGITIKAEPVEQLVAEMVLVRLGEVRAQKRSAVPAGDVVPGEADRLRAELAEMAEMVGNGQLSMGEWRAARPALQARLEAAEAAEARADASSALARVAGDEATLAERWDDLDNDLRRRLISLVLDHVTIAPPTGKVLDLDRVTPTWKA